MIVSDLLKVVKGYQLVILVDEHRVCVYRGRAELVPTMLLQHKVENLSSVSEYNALLVTCVS